MPPPEPRSPDLTVVAAADPSRGEHQLTVAIAFAAANSSAPPQHIAPRFDPALQRTTDALLGFQSGGRIVHARYLKHSIAVCHQQSVATYKTMTRRAFPLGAMGVLGVSALRLTTLLAARNEKSAAEQEPSAR